MNNENRSEFEKEARRLRAELTILRANMSKMEKENDALKIEKSKFVLNKIDLESEIKKKLEMRDKELRIEENQRKSFKVNDNDQSLAVSSKFILENTLDLTNLSDESFLKNLKFFKDFFFDDFYSIPDSKALEIVEFFHLKGQKEFLESFDIFCCKKTVFTKFCATVFDDNSFVQNKISILLEVPPEWIVELYDLHLKRFITSNRNILVELYATIAEFCPFHLKKVLDKSAFNSFLKDISNPLAYKLVFFIVKHRVSDYIDETNLHLIPSNFVCYFFNTYDSDLIDLN